MARANVPCRYKFWAFPRSLPKKGVSRRLKVFCLALLTFLVLLAVVAVARVFRRGDFRSHWHKSLASEEASYNFGAAGQAKKYRIAQDVNRAGEAPASRKRNRLVSKTPLRRQMVSSA